MTDRESYEPSPFSSFGEDEESENASDLQAEHPRVGPHDSVADDGFMPHPDRPAFKYERIDLDDNIFENEPIYCCDGRISLNHVSVAINIFVIVATCVGVSTCAVVIYNGSRAVVGAASLRHFIISAALLLPSFAIVFGIVLFICGCLGLYLALRGENQGFGSQDVRLRKIDVTYHSSMYLSSLLTFFFIIGAITATAIAYRPDAVYSKESWRLFSHGHPRFLCALEHRLQCAAFQTGDCRLDNENPTRFSNCPGIFCVEFCRVAPDIPPEQSSVQPLCRPCRVRNNAFASFYARCRQLELSLALESASGCAVPAVNDLRSSLACVIGIAVVYLSCVIILNSVALYRLCYLL